MGYTPHVLVVGGGPLGAGLARDFAIRGLDVTLADPGPLAAPRVGRVDGLLASGAQFAREDPQYARRCLEENRTLFEIASHCVEDTGGLVVDDDLDALQAACETCGIAAHELSGTAAREREPGLSSAVDGALAVPDAAIDPFRLTVATARDAHAYGADIRPRTEVTDIRVENGAVDSVRLRYDPLPDGVEHPDHEEDDDADDADDGESGNGGADDAEDGEDGESGNGDGDDSEETEDDSGEDNDSEDDSGDDDEGSAGNGGSGEDESDGGEIQPDGGKRMPGTLDVKVNRRPTVGEWPEPSVETIDVDYIVNVAGTEAADIAALAGCSLPVDRQQATMLVASGRPVGTAVTRPAGATADSVVPVGRQTLLDIGGDTTGIDDHGARPAPSSVDAVGERLSEVVAGLAKTRTLRSFRMPRYDIEPGQGRDFVTADHDDQGCWGLLTVLGGTVTTHRWVAEQICDRVCREFGIRRTCRTDELALPGSEGVPAAREPRAAVDGPDSTGEVESTDTETAAGSTDPGETFGLADEVYRQSVRRLGSEADTVLDTEGPNPVLCPCQSVTRAEVQATLDAETTSEVDLGAVRVGTSATAGDCQGGRCAHRLAAELHPTYALEVVDGAMDELLAERWDGQRPVTGGQITEMARNYRLHAGTMSRKHDPVELDHEDLTLFDSGIERTVERPTCCPRVGWES